MQENLLSLDDVKTHFEHWRTTRIKQRERIPQYLWEEVRTLLDRYLLSEITTALRINTSQIKYNLNQADIVLETWSPLNKKHRYLIQTTALPSYY